MAVFLSLIVYSIYLNVINFRTNSTCTKILRIDALYNFISYEHCRSDYLDRYVKKVRKTNKIISGGVVRSYEGDLICDIN